MTRGRVFAVLGLVLAVLLGAHPAAVLITAAAVIALALGALGFAIAITVAETGGHVGPWCSA